MSERFPILGESFTIPWEAIEPGRYQAFKNHGQSLERLAERGGLSLVEVVGILDGLEWRELRNINIAKAKQRVLALSALEKQESMS